MKYRRLQGDMIEVYKITHDMYDKSVALELPRNVSTRGNKYKLQNHSFHYNFRKFSFAARIVNAWNSLPDHVTCYLLLVVDGRRSRYMKSDS